MHAILSCSVYSLFLSSVPSFPFFLFFHYFLLLFWLPCSLWFLCYCCLYFWFRFFLVHAFPTAFTLSYFFTCFHAVVTLYPTTYVISFGLVFLSFMQFLLLILFAIPCFFPSCFFIFCLTPILLYKRIWSFVGQIIFIESKGSWTQFALTCQSHSTKDLYSTINHFPLHYSLNPNVSLGF